MGKRTIGMILRGWAVGFGWRLILWAAPMTEEQFRYEIYRDVRDKEKELRDKILQVL